jgi:hypothetical protein
MSAGRGRKADSGDPRLRTHTGPEELTPLIAALRTRITKAKTERDTWRSSGVQEKYLEAYSLVEALELQLESLREEGLRPISNRAAP